MVGSESNRLAVARDGLYWVWRPSTLDVIAGTEEPGVSRMVQPTINTHCAACGYAFSIPAGIENFFCPRCGHAIMMTRHTDQVPLTQPDTFSIRDKGSGRRLFVVRLPDDWQVQSTSLRSTGSASQPYIPRVMLKHPTGSNLTLERGDAGTRNSASMQHLMNTYGRALAGVDRTNYAPMPHPIPLADAQVQKLVSTLRKNGCEVVGPRLVQTLAVPNIEARRQNAMAFYRRLGNAVGGGAQLREPFVAEFCRVHEFLLNDEPYTSASYVRLYAVKDAASDGIGAAGMMMGGLGGLLGGLISAGFSKRESRAQAEAVPASVASGLPAWCAPDFAAYNKGGTVLWSVEGVASLNAPSIHFDELFHQVFLPFAGTFLLHDDVWDLIVSDSLQHAAALQQVTNQTVANMNAQTQAALAADRQRQAAFDAQLASWHAASDAHHAAFRERTNAQFGGSSGGGVGDFSEAIRGVNTFVTSDGREVELSVQSDRAYENQAGDVIGGSGGFDPGADWTEIPRA